MGRVQRNDSTVPTGLCRLVGERRAVSSPHWRPGGRRGTKVSQGQRNPRATPHLGAGRALYR